MKSKTLAAWLTLLTGPLGGHRFYLLGTKDVLAWLMPIPTALGVWGMERVKDYGLDDRLSWVLLPLLGLHIAACCLQAIIYGLATPEAWNARFNPQADSTHPAGRTGWPTFFAIMLSLMVGTVALLSAIAYGTQRYFEVTLEPHAQGTPSLHGNQVTQRGALSSETSSGT